MVDEKRQEESGQVEGGQVIAPQSGQRTPSNNGLRTAVLKPRLAEGRGRVTAQAGSCPTCAAGADSGPPAYVYVIGTIDVRFPSLGVEKEFRQSVAGNPTANLTDKGVVYNTLKAARYLANEVCWVFTVENIETYLLVPRDREMLDQFIEAVKPSQRGIDIDVIIGTRGPIAPAEMCNGLQIPIVLVDQSYSFDRPALVKEIKKPKELKMTEEAFRTDADELFNRVQQLADNVGATDEHRALNYLAVRSQDVYARTAELHGREFSLTGVDVVPSRLSGMRKLADVIFTFTNRNTDVVEKYFVRVDVTEKYPFLEKKWSPYYDRQ